MIMVLLIELAARLKTLSSYKNVSLTSDDRTVMNNEDQKYLII